MNHGMLSIGRRHRYKDKGIPMVVSGEVED